MTIDVNGRTVNTTNYEHSSEPNLNDLHKAMKYNNTGEPQVRVHVDGISLEGDVIVDKVKLYDGTNDLVFDLPSNDGETAPWSLPTENHNMVFNGSTWDRMRGNTTDGVLTKLTNGSIAVTGTFWQATQPVSGTVTIQDGGNTITVDGTVTADVTFPTTQQVSGTVALDATTLSALENTTVTISGTPTVNIGTIPEVEIKNDSGNPIPISATTATNSALNPIYITGAVTTAGGSAQGKLWFFQIAQGLIPGHRSLFKAGYNPSIANNTEESLWAHSNLYPWASWGAGGTLSCVSASASDTGTLEIVGLRTSDWTEITEIVTMTGTTPVVTTNSFIRINSVHYSSSISNVGEIDVNRNGVAVAHIEVGFGLGQMAQYTVPAGYTAYLLSGNANLGKGNDGTGKFKYRPYGGSFQTAMTFLLFQSTFNYTFEAPLPLPEKTDLDVTVLASVSGTAVTCAYSMVLIAN